MGSILFCPDLLTILMVYLFLFHGHTAAVTFAFGQGFLIDLFSGGLHGLYTALYLIVFAAISLGARFFNLLSITVQVFVVLVAVLLKDMLFLVMLKVFSPDIYIPKSFLLTSGAFAMVTALIAPIIFYLFNRLTGEDMAEVSE